MAIDTNSGSRSRVHPKQGIPMLGSERVRDLFCRWIDLEQEFVFPGLDSRLQR